MRPIVIRRHPLLQLLAVNLAFGVAIAVMAVGGLLILDAHGLRSLILRDQSPVVALSLIFFGFIISFGSWVMGTAIMRIGRER
jgi:hypothetical protein